jgi:hypothetical protein
MVFARRLSIRPHALSNFSPYNEMTFSNLVGLVVLLVCVAVIAWNVYQDLK